MEDRLFISYASEDSAQVRTYLRDLAAVGLHVWLDQNEIQPSDALVRRINEGIAGAKYALVFFSARYEAKPWTNAEHDAIVAAAVIHRDRKVFVVCLDDTALPPLLAGKLYFAGSIPTDEVAKKISSIVLQQDVQRSSSETSALSLPAVRNISIEMLSDVSIEALAEMLLIGGLGRCTTHRAGTTETFSGYVHGVGSVRVHLRRDALTPARFADFETIAEIGNTHRTFLGHLEAELAEGGLGVFKPAYLIKINKRIIQLTDNRKQLRDFLSGFIAQIELLDS